MNTCVCCGNEYQEKMTECPYCGCPKNYFSIPFVFQKGAFLQTHILIGKRDTCTGENAWVFWNQAEQKKVEAFVIPAGEEGKAFYKNLEKLSTDPYSGNIFPKIVSRVWIDNETGGYYVIEVEEGRLLSHIIEREYPLPLRERILVEKAIKPLYQNIFIEYSGRMDYQKEKNALFLKADDTVRFSDYEVLRRTFEKNTVQPKQIQYGRKMPLVWMLIGILVVIVILFIICSWIL